MPIFTYTARTAQGEIRSATLEAASRDEVMAKLGMAPRLVAATGRMAEEAAK